MQIATKIRAELFSFSKVLNARTAERKESEGGKVWCRVVISTPIREVGGSIWLAVRADHRLNIEFI